MTKRLLLAIICTISLLQPSLFWAKEQKPLQVEKVIIISQVVRFLWWMVNNIYLDVKLARTARQVVQKSKNPKSSINT